MKVDTADPVVRDRVALIANTVIAAGGYIHPDLVVHQRGASLWTSLPSHANPYRVEGGSASGKPHSLAPPLLIVPDAVHVPVTDLDWEPHDSVLRYRGDTGHLSEAQSTILEAMVDLFNAVDKVRQVGANYPLNALEGDRELYDSVRRARPAFGSRRDPDAAQWSSAPSLMVVRSRLRSGMTEGEEGPVGYFMPMIDMLNHHPYGSRYRREASGDWRIDVHHPTPTDQVFVRYNRADSLGNALGLGYAETDTTFVDSVACEVSNQVLGSVLVKGVSAGRRRIAAPQITRSDNGLTVSGLLLGVRELDTVRRLLAMPVRVIAPHVDADEVVQALLVAVHGANVSYYQELLDVCTAAAPDQGDPRLREMLAVVSRHQLRLLDDFAAALHA